MQETYNVGIYCRLSREDERTGESVSVENQREMLGRYVHEQGWNLYAAYCDDGVSGTTFDRPMFNQMIADARAGKINLILCKDLSRLGRDYIETGRLTDIVFPSMGCRFIALNDGVDTIAEQMKQARLLLTSIERRLSELGKLVQAIYEDKVMGRIPEAVCVQLMNQYEAERKEKLEQKAHLSSELEAYQQETDDVQQWMRLIREYTKLEELDRPTLLRLIKRIEVGEKKVEDGCTVRDIRIHYNFVGYIES